MRSLVAPVDRWGPWLDGADARDGRAKRVVYSRRGKALVRDVDRVLQRVSAELSALLGAERFERLCADLARLDAAVNGEGAALLLPPRR